MKTVPRPLFPNLVPRKGEAAYPCPECDVGMLAFSCGPTRVEKCPLCHGIWFRAKAFAVFRDTLARFDLGALKIRFPGRALEAKREVITACPRCEEALVPFRFSYNTKVMLERCERCQGLWLPPEELPHVIELAQISQAIAPDLEGLAREMKIAGENIRRDRAVAGALRALTERVGVLTNFLFGRGW